MTMLPPILREEYDSGSEKYLFELSITQDLPHFMGHFPAFPILPGVIQLDWAITLGQKYYSISQKFKAVERLKFNAPVRPDCMLTLILEHKTIPDANSYLQFSYQSQSQPISSGRVVFGESV